MYGLKYTSEFNSHLGHNYIVKILQKDYASSITELVMGGEPVVINFNGVEEKFDVIRGSECVLQFYCNYDYQFSEIVTADKNEFKIEVYKNGNIYWSGFVIQDNYNEPFQPLPYLTTIRAIDGLGDLKQYEFKDYANKLILNRMTQIEVVLACLSKLKNATQLVTSIDIYESRIDKNNLNNEALNRVFVNPVLYFKGDDKVSNCADVIKSILELYNAFIYYKEGKYYIERLNYKLSDSIVTRTYNISFDSFSSTVNTNSTSYILGQIGQNQSLKLINNDGNLTYTTPYKFVEVENDINYPKEVVINSQFQNWDTSNTTPANWQNNGLSISITGNTVINSLLYVSSVNDNDSTVTANYLSNNLKLDSNTFTSVIKGSDKLKIKAVFFGNIRMMVKLVSDTGSLYLRQLTAGDNSSLTWSATVAFLKLPSPAVNYSSRTYKYTNFAYNWWAVSDFETPIINDVIYNRLEVYILPAYNLSGGWSGNAAVKEISIAFNPDTTDGYKGEIYTLKSNKSYTEIYKDLKPILGEFNNVGYSNQLLYPTSSGFTVTESWARDGKSESKSLIEIASRSILNQYRLPYLDFTGSVVGNFDVGKVYNIQDLGGRFHPYKASQFLKTDVTNISMYQLLYENGDVEATDNYTKKQNLGKPDFNVIKAPEEVDTNRPRPSRGSDRNRN